MTTEENKRVVQRMVDEVINGGDLDVLDEIYAPDGAAAMKEWVEPFRTAFPDVHMKTVQLVAEGDTVVGHFLCSGTQAGEWMGRPARGGSFRDVREVYWFTVQDGRIVDGWGLEDNDDRRLQLRRSSTR